MTVSKHNAIAVFVNAMTKYVGIVPCIKESSGADWAHMFKDHIHARLPQYILSDRGTPCSGLCNQMLAERLGYSWRLTIAHAPWSDCQTERTDRVIEDGLCHLLSADMQD